MLSSQAFASLQHGFLRTMENVFIHNLVTPNGVWEIFFFIILTLIFIFVMRQMLCLYVSMADVIAWQMLYALLKLKQMLFPRGRCYPLSSRVADVIANSAVEDCYTTTACCTFLCWLVLLPCGRWNNHILFIMCCDGRWNGHCRA